MLKDFVKINTFLTLARERSFSKTSAKLGISQPAVSQQVKFIENFLGEKIVERKKGGLRLTQAGEELYKIFLRIENSILETEQDILRIINKQMTFRLGASYTIGSYVIPGECLNSMSEEINNHIQLDINTSQEIVTQLKNRKLDIGLIESPIMDHDLIYREWLEDELVIVSNVPIAKTLNTEDLLTFDWICRNEGSHTKRIIQEAFEDIGVSCKEFNVLSEVDNTTTILNTIKRAAKDESKPIASILSKYAVLDEVAKGELFESKIKGCTMSRKLYIAYSKENKRNAYIETVTNRIMDGYCNN